MKLTSSGYSGIGVEQVSQMVFDEAELAKLRKNAPDFKESYDMGEFHLLLQTGESEDNHKYRSCRTDNRI